MFHCLKLELKKIPIRKNIGMSKYHWSSFREVPQVALEKISCRRLHSCESSSTQTPRLLSHGEDIWILHHVCKSVSVFGVHPSSETFEMIWMNVRESYEYCEKEMLENRTRNEDKVKSKPRKLAPIQPRDRLVTFATRSIPSSTALIFSQGVCIYILFACPRGAAFDFFLLLLSQRFLHW